MANELNDVLETAMYKEVASQSFYSAALHKVDDPAARALLKEIADDESRHYQRLQQLIRSGPTAGQRHIKSIHDLGISEYLTSSDTIEGAGLQDTLIFAMKREQHAVEFYSGLKSLLTTKEAKALCEQLVREELTHKRRLELLYDEIFYAED